MDMCNDVDTWNQTKPFEVIDMTLHRCIEAIKA